MVRASWLAVLAISWVGLGGCLEAGLVPCGDQLCPATTICVAETVCATTGQVAACDGLSEDASCSIAGNVGRCTGGICVGTGCGNGVVDLDEVCDDGNTTSGDGCRSDCRKLEVCGDGVVDDGEGCDDGNTNPADRCDACAPTRWFASAVIGGTSNATAVGLNVPSAIATDRNGNLYVAETFANRVLRVDTTGVVTVLAGEGTAGFSGDGGAASTAALKRPSGLAVDGLGNVFIADTSNQRIRRVSADGTITTVAGGGTAGSAGDGGPATSAQLAFPNDVAVDGLGNLYIADTNNHRIRRVDVSGVITTVAGSTAGSTGDGGPATSALLNSPRSVAIDVSGALFIADRNNNRIRRIDPDGTISTVAGTGPQGMTGDGGPAMSAQLFWPEAIEVDAAGVLYIGDVANQRVRRVDSAGVITTFAGSATPGFPASSGFAGDGGPATAALLAGPVSLAVDPSGGLYLADVGNYRIRHVDVSGAISTLVGTGTPGATGDGGAALSARLNGPRGVVADGAGGFYVADNGNHRIRHVDAAGVITTVAGLGVAGYGGDGGPASAALLSSPYAVTRDAQGALYVADRGNQRIRRIDATGVITTVAGFGSSGFSGDGGPATSARIYSPSGVAIDSVGNLYIADTGNHRIRRVAVGGVITTIAGTGTDATTGDGGPAIAAALSNPTAVHVDASDNVLIAQSHRIRAIDGAGDISTIAGIATPGWSGDGGAATSAELSQPSALAGDLDDLYIADSANNRIRHLDATGVIETVAGTGAGASGSGSGDGGAAVDAQLFFPAGIALDDQGRLLVSDTLHGRVRTVDATRRILTVAGQLDPDGMGPIAQARLANPRALALVDQTVFVAGGTSGQLLRAGASNVEVLAGRYPQGTATGALARFRDYNFGTVSGVAYDDAAGAIYLTESSSHRIQVISVTDAADHTTWTIAPLANATGTAGFADGGAATARFRDPRGLYFDAATRQLYVADAGNHVIRAIDLTMSPEVATVRTVAGGPATRGYFGDGGSAGSALLYAPEAITRCANGDLFIADTGNQRVRRIAAATGVITTVLGVGVGASSGEGAPAATFPVNAPRGLACDAVGNLFVTSASTVRMVAADSGGEVDGSQAVYTIYGRAPRERFPESVTNCLSDLVVVDGTTVRVSDACTGLLIELRRIATP